MKLSVEERQQWIDHGNILNMCYLFIVEDIDQEKFYPVYIPPGKNPLVKKHAIVTQDNGQKLIEIIELDFARL